MERWFQANRWDKRSSKTSSKKQKDLVLRLVQSVSPGPLTPLPPPPIYSPNLFATGTNIWSVCVHTLLVLKLTSLSERNLSCHQNVQVTSSPSPSWIRWRVGSSTQWVDIVFTTVYRNLDFFRFPKENQTFCHKNGCWLNHKPSLG